MAVLVEEFVYVIDMVQQREDQAIDLDPSSPLTSRIPIDPSTTVGLLKQMIYEQKLGSDYHPDNLQLLFLKSQGRGASALRPLEWVSPDHRTLASFGGFCVPSSTPLASSACWLLLKQKVIPVGTAATSSTSTHHTSVDDVEDEDEADYEALSDDREPLEPDDDDLKEVDPEDRAFVQAEAEALAEADAFAELDFESEEDEADLDVAQVLQPTNVLEDDQSRWRSMRAAHRAHFKLRELSQDSRSGSASDPEVSALTSPPPDTHFIVPLASRPPPKHPTPLSDWRPARPPSATTPEPVPRSNMKSPTPRRMSRALTTAQAAASASVPVDNPDTESVDIPDELSRRFRSIHFDNFPPAASAGDGAAEESAFLPTGAPPTDVSSSEPALAISCVPDNSDDEDSAESRESSPGPTVSGAVFLTNADFRRIFKLS